MLDYSNKNDKYLFITHYSIKDGLIWLEYANGDIRKVNDTPYNRSIVDEKMTEQVSAALNKKNYISALSILLNVSVVALGVVLLSNEFSKELETILTCLESAGALYLVIDTIKRTKKINELKKLKYFLENRQKLNEVIKKENISAGLSKRKQSVIAESEEEVFDFNSIDMFSLKDIKKIDTNIKREETLNFEYTLKKTI